MRQNKCDFEGLGQFRFPYFCEIDFGTFIVEGIVVGNSSEFKSRLNQNETSQFDQHLFGDVLIKHHFYKET